MKTMHLLINPHDRKSHISREIYGHFAEHLGRCIYGGIFVGKDSPIPNIRGIRTDVVDAMRKLQVPVLRWPGGCFADTYHWKNGVGPQEQRKPILNTNWGNVTEDNSFGTHEFFDLCEQVGAEPYLAANLGSGTVEELADWIEYITFDGDSPMANWRRKNGREEPWKLKYIGLGNEAYGCGGNMTCRDYAAKYRQYATFCKDFSGNKLFKVASGCDEKWAAEIIEALKSDITQDMAQAITLHYYSFATDSFAAKGSATEFTNAQYYHTLRSTQDADRAIDRHCKIMDLHDPEKKLALVVDEWGGWYDVEPGTNPGFLYQQNTMRDALVAAKFLHIFHTHSDRVKLANLAQVVNVLQSIILTEGENMLLTPTYHVLDMFKGHMDNTLLYSHLDNETENGVRCLSQCASADEQGNIQLTVSNASLERDYEIRCLIPGTTAKKITGCILTGDVRAFNNFEAPEKVKPLPLNICTEDDALCFTLPPCSVASIEIETV